MADSNPRALITDQISRISQDFKKLETDRVTLQRLLQEVRTGGILLCEVGKAQVQRKLRDIQEAQDVLYGQIEVISRIPEGRILLVEKLRSLSGHRGPVV